MTSSRSSSVSKISKWIDAQPGLRGCPAKIKQRFLKGLCVECGLELQDLFYFDREDLKYLCDSFQIEKRWEMKFIKAVQQYKHRRMSNKDEAETETHGTNSFSRHADNNNHNSNSNSNRGSNNNNGLKIDAGDSEHTRQIKRQLEKLQYEYLYNQEKQNKKLLVTTLNLFESSSNLHVKVNEEVFRLLDNNIPIVTIMGPSRQGKSTLINDMMGAQNLCRVSNSANEAATNGAWICLYVHPQTKKPLFYLIDAEGLSHNVTTFTQRLFYVCYAISNVFIWNDKAVGDKQFDECMDKIYSRMTLISRSDQKPAFIYLQRDAGFFDYAECADFNHYIQESDSFSYLRNMNIFSSLNGYELDRRPSKKTPFSKQDMSLLTDFIFNACSNSTRFMTDLADCKPQIQEINYSLRLSLEVKLICEHPILKCFYYGINDGSDGYKANKLIKMTSFAVSQVWNAKKVKAVFDAAFYEFCSLVHKENGIVLDGEMAAILQSNQQELYERVKNKKSKTKEIELSTIEQIGIGIGTGIAAFASGIAIAATFGLAAIPLTMGAMALNTLLSEYYLGATDAEKARARARKHAKNKSWLTRVKAAFYN